MWGTEAGLRLSCEEREREGTGWAQGADSW